MLVSGRVCHWKTGGWVAIQSQSWRLFSPLNFWWKLFLKTAQQASNLAKSPKPKKKTDVWYLLWLARSRRRYICSFFVFLEAHLFTIETYLETKKFLAPKSFQTCHVFSSAEDGFPCPFRMLLHGRFGTMRVFFLSGTTNEQWKNLVV